MIGVELGMGYRGSLGCGVGVVEFGLLVVRLGGYRLVWGLYGDVLIWGECSFRYGVSSLWDF